MYLYMFKCRCICIYTYICIYMYICKFVVMYIYACKVSTNTCIYIGIYKEQFQPVNTERFPTKFKNFGTSGADVHYRLPGRVIFMYIYTSYLCSCKNVYLCIFFNSCLYMWNMYICKHMFIYMYHMLHMYMYLYACLYTQRDSFSYLPPMPLSWIVLYIYVSGMTNYAVQAWFSLIATGLGVSEDDSRKRTDGVMDFWYWVSR
jgi:hypothetical protein